MKYGSIKGIITSHIEENRFFYIIQISIFLTGIVLGSIFLARLPKDAIQSTMDTINTFCKTLVSADVSKWEICQSTLWTNLKTVGILWLGGLSYFMIIFPCINILLKGFVIGFTMGFITIFFGTKGFALGIVTLLPQLLIYLPLLLLATTISLSNIRVKHRYGGKISPLKLHSIKMSVVFLLLSAYSLIDIFIMPLFMANISGYFV